MRLTIHTTSYPTEGLDTALFPVGLEASSELGDPNPVLVINQDRLLAPSGIEATAEVGVAQVPGASYETLVEQDWSTYPDKASLSGLISTESQLHNLWKPVLPVTDFYDLVSTTAPDKNGVMGTRNALRYLRAVALNPKPVIATALATGTAGNDIRITVSAGTSSGRKYVVTNHPTTPTITETFDNLTRQNILTAVNGVSTLIAFNTDLNNTGPALLPGWASGSPKVYALTGGAIGVAASFQFIDNLRGRVAVHGTSFPATRYVGVRTFFKFSSNWRIGADVGGENAASYKMFFLRNTSGSRYEFEPNAGREWVSNVGQPQNNPPGSVQVTNTPLAHHNVVVMNTLYAPPGGSLSGFPQPDLACYEDGTGMMFKTPPQPPLAPTGDGEEETWELRWFVECGRGGLPYVLRQTQALRQYTQAGVYDPLAWRFNAYDATAPTTSVWGYPNRWETGVYSNRQSDESMWSEYNSHQVVDLDLYMPSWAAELGIGL